MTITLNEAKNELEKLYRTFKAAERALEIANELTRLDHENRTITDQTEKLKKERDKENEKLEKAKQKTSHAEQEAKEIIKAAEAQSATLIEKAQVEHERILLSIAREKENIVTLENNKTKLLESIYLRQAELTKLEKDIDTKKDDIAKMLGLK